MKTILINLVSSFIIKRIMKKVEPNCVKLYESEKYFISACNSFDKKEVSLTFTLK